MNLLKGQLRRVGRYLGPAASTEWGPVSCRAIENFNKYAGTRLEVTMPTAEALEEVRVHEARVCPCDRGSHLESDRCVRVGGEKAFAPTPDANSKKLREATGKPLSLEGTRAVPPAMVGQGRRSSGADCIELDGRRYCE